MRRRPTTVAKDSSRAGGEPHLIHVHVCIYCGYLLRREEVDGLQVASGIFHCSKCDLDGPLNVEIREATEVNVSPGGLRESESSTQR
jgi:hypothetical protein